MTSNGKVRPLLVVHPGATYATGDLYRGLVPALKRQGVVCIEYPLYGALEDAGWLLMHKWKQHRIHGGPLKDVKPTPQDILYLASHWVVERALRFDCKWVLIVSGMYFHVQVMRHLRLAGRKLALLLTESPYDLPQEWKAVSECDAAWTNERTCVEALRLANPNVWYLPHAYDPERHTPDAPVREDVPHHDVVFVGTGFPERRELLSAINWEGIDLGLYGEWSSLGSRNPLRRFVKQGPIDNTVTAALYRQAKVGLNLFRTSCGFGDNTPRITTAESLNPRLLELAACGAFTISEWRPEVAEVFWGAVPTFQTPEEAETLIRRALARPDMRRHFALMARQRVGQSGRTFDAMAAQVVSNLQGTMRPVPKLEEAFGVASAAAGG